MTNTIKYEPSPETLAINKVLEPLGFSHCGEFYPIEFDLDDYNWIEIGRSAIAYTDTYVAILDYSLMEYWEHADPKLAKSALALAEKAVKDLEKVDG